MDFLLKKFSAKILILEMIFDHEQNEKKVEQKSKNKKARNSKHHDNTEIWDATFEAANTTGAL